MLPSVECALPVQRIELAPQHTSEGLKALEERERGGW